MKPDRDTLIDRLMTASKRSRVECYVLQTIALALQDQKISPKTALTWLRDEELVGQIERR
jgi:hypothetical protein